MTTGTTLGETYDPLGAHLQDPYPFYARAREQEPVFWSPAVRAWVFTRYEHVREALRRPEVFSSANTLRQLEPLVPEAVAVMRTGYPPRRKHLDADGEQHRRLRAPFAHGLARARIDQAESSIRRRVDELVDGFAGDGEAEVMGQYAYRLPVDVITDLFGIPAEERGVVADGSYSANRMRHSNLPAAEQVAAAKAYVALQALCGRYAQQRRRNPGQDMISEVVVALFPGDGPLTFEQEGEAAQLLMTTVLAGHITISASIGNALRHLLTHREQWELLCEQPELVDSAVEESLRYDPPTHAFTRITTRPVTLGGIDLDEGAEVLLLYGSANRDPALCDRPEVFDITRPRVRHLAFADGPHACVGAALARRELAATLQTLTRRLPKLRLAPGQEFWMQGTLTLRGLTALEVIW